MNEDQRSINLIIQYNDICYNQTFNCQTSMKQVIRHMEKLLDMENFVLFINGHYYQHDSRTKLGTLLNNDKPIKCSIIQKIIPNPKKIRNQFPQIGLIHSLRNNMEQFIQHLQLTEIYRELLDYQQRLQIPDSNTNQPQPQHEDINESIIDITDIDTDTFDPYIDFLMDSFQISFPSIISGDMEGSEDPITIASSTESESSDSIIEIK